MAANLVAKKCYVKFRLKEFQQEFTHICNHREENAHIESVSRGILKKESL